MTLKQAYKIRDSLLTKQKTQYRVVNTSLSLMHMTLRNITGVDYIYKPTLPRILKASRNKSNCTIKITRRDDLYKVSSINHDGLKMKLVKNAPRYVPY